MGFGPFDSEIFPLIAVIRKLDTAATEAAGGYDPVFREPYLTDSDDDGIGEPDTQYGDEIRIRCQLESGNQEKLTMGPDGDTPTTFLTMSVFRAALSEKGELGADGKPTIAVGSRLSGLEDIHGEVMWTYDRPDGLHLDEIRMADAHLANRNNFFLFQWVSWKEGPTA